jgi:23S rRNA pseudouridine2604 synthase
MSFSRKIKYFLVHTSKLTNKRAQELIDAGSVQIDGVVVKENTVIGGFSEIKAGDQVLRAKKQKLYLKFYKPRGYESTLNEGVPANLAFFFNGLEGLAIAGRLDKWSEGLLVLSNDGPWIERLCHPSSGKEKEYLVMLDKPPLPEFFKAFSAGVQIGSYLTLPCVCEPYTGNGIRVVLTEGKNRQIRRMCQALGYKVLDLKRIRIGTIGLDELEPGQTELIPEHLTLI